MKKITDVTIVLDRSGSMQAIQEETILGFNEFVKDQQSSKRDVRLTLVQFDDVYEQVFLYRKLEKVPMLDRERYVPRGATALLDAIGRTIISVKKRQKELLKEDVKLKVLFVIITDGYENASTEFTKKDILKKIRKSESEHNWEFIYLGANQDAIHEAEKLGISYNRSLTYKANRSGTKAMFNSLSKSISLCLLDDSNEFTFTEDERDKQKRENE